MRSVNKISPIIKQIYELWNFLNLRFKLVGTIVLFFSVISAFLETLSIGAIIPIVSLLSDKEVFYNFINSKSYLTFLNKYDFENLIIIFLILLFTSYFLKSSFLIFSAWFSSKYIFNIKLYLSNKLFTKYIYSDYKFHLNTNSSILLRNITNDIQIITGNIIYPLLITIVEILTVIFIITFLFYFEPFGVILILLLIGSALVIFQMITSNILQNWGISRQKNEGKRIQAAQEGFVGIKDIKILGRENSIINKFFQSTKIVSLIEAKQLTLSIVPRLWLELVAIFVLCLFIIYSISSENSSISIISTMALFAAAAVRLLPSSNRILNAFQNFKYAISSVSIYVESFSENVKSKNINNNFESINFQHNIKFKDVSFNYVKGKSVLEDINISINKHECIGIVGNSGSGKSTLVDLILGLIQPSKGEIRVDNKTFNLDNKFWKKNFGYVPQNIFLSDDTIKNNICLGLNEKEIDIKSVNNAIKLSSLKNFIANLENNIDSFVGERGIKISGGQKQRLGIARALYTNPDILVFDEATSSLDEKTENEIINSIYELKRNKTLIIISHKTNTLKKCDKIIKINNKKATMFNTKDFFEQNSNA